MLLLVVFKLIEEAVAGLCCMALAHRREMANSAHRCATVFLLASALHGCSSVPCNHCTRANEPIPSDSSLQCTRATIAGLTPETLPNRVFVGIAMSGGGSRAANFSSAVLLKLDELGILPKATAISSVSGSSLTNAYYARWGNSPERLKYWKEEELKRRLNENSQTQWELEWFFPQNMVKYWATDFDRSDIMKGVFDKLLFDGTHPNFSDIGQRPCDTPQHTAASPPLSLPVVLINATTLAGRNFVFTDEDFRSKLNSRLDTYPLSDAIMASAAFPGAFQNVTLEQFPTSENGTRKRRYQHLFDGGPSDNLGVEAILNSLHAIDRKTPQGESLKGCLFILVDSYTDSTAKLSKQYDRSDTRQVFDFIVSDNFDNAFDAMLAHRREDTLADLDLHFDSPEEIGKSGLWPYQPFRNAEGPNSDLTCHVWHLTFQRLPRLANVPDATAVAKQANDIKTAFRLGNFIGMNKVKQQNTLYRAADILTREDSENLAKIRELFRMWGWPLQQ